MAPLPTNPATSAALRDAIKDGTYPEAEELLVADLSADAITPLLRSISEARNEISEEIRLSSRDDVQDVDSWIEQAKRVQDEIAQCKIEARRIVEQHHQLEKLRSEERVATGRSKFLQEEITFTESLNQRLREMEDVAQIVRSTDELLVTGNIVGAAHELSNLDKQVSVIPAPRARSLVENIAGDLRARCAARLEERLEATFRIERSISHATLEIYAEGHENTSSTVEAFDGLIQVRGSTNMSISVVNRIAAFFLRSLKGSSQQQLATFSISERRFDISYGKTTPSSTTILDFVQNFLTFIQLHCPARMLPLVASCIYPEYTNILTAKWLTPSIPLELSDLPALKHLQNEVDHTAKFLRDARWQGHEDLSDWAEHAPRLWLARRKANALDAVRRAFSNSHGSLRQVERVERQIVQNNSSAAALVAREDDWDAGWDEDKLEIKDVSLEKFGQDEDASGWGFDDEDDENNAEDASAKSSTTQQPTSNGTKAQMSVDKDDNDENDAWGWDDDTPAADETESSRPAATPKRKKQQPNGKTSEAAREVTLTEFYSISEIPDHLVEVIGKEIYDSQDVQNVSDSIFQSPAVSAALLALPTLALAMFRATAPTYYGNSRNLGNMNLYNDSMYIIEKLHNLGPSSGLASIDADCKAMEKFARSAYAKEMEVQRTILNDLLDGAQGFSSCTKFPYSQEIERAVTGTVERMKQVYEEWQPTLSSSALLQSLGALLSAIISKIITDIEEMEDISEPESQRLTSYCNQIAELESLFLARPPGAESDDTKAIAMTAVYVPDWLRFQYLINILESSLVDIGYLWTDGELSLEYTADEVIDLIKALFAESNHRRNAISSIRTHPPKR